MCHCKRSVTRKLVLPKRDEIIKAACFLLGKGGVIHKEVNQKSVGNVIKMKLLLNMPLPNMWLFSAFRHVFVGLCHNLADSSFCQAYNL